MFLRYIERVLPSLGEAGVEQVVLADLVPDVTFASAADARGAESEATRRVKGDVRMAEVIDRAVGDRERALSRDLTVPFRTGYLRLSVEESARIVRSVARRARRHNSGRRLVEQEFFAALAASWRGTEVTPAVLRRELCGRARGARRARADVAGAHAGAAAPRPVRLERPAAPGRRATCSSDDEIDLLRRERSENVDDVRWTPSDVALLDDAREALGPAPGRNGKVGESDEIRTYGHIVVDEVQDLTPMQLRMVARRSLNGSLTVVGDLAQATGPWAPSDWSDVTRYLPDKGTPRRRAVGGLPHPVADHAAGRSGDARGDAGAAAAAGGARRRFVAACGRRGVS